MTTVPGGATTGRSAAEGPLECKNCDHRSFSSMCAFARCPRLYAWKKQLNLERPSPTRDVALVFGSAIHAAAPFTWQRDTLPLALEAFRNKWGDRDALADAKRNSRTGLAIVTSLCDLHSSPSFPYVAVAPEHLTPGEGPHEATFEVELGLPSGKPVTGRIDVSLRHKHTEAVGFGEYKTASQIWGTFPDIFIKSLQIETYALALRVSGTPASFALVEGILVAKGKTETLVVPVELSDERLTSTLEWWRRQDKALSALENEAEGDPLAWPAQWENCTPYATFGLQGFVCEYQPLCLAENRWPQLLGLYEVKVSEEEEGAVE